MPDVSADRWHDEVREQAAAGHAYLDLLTAVDRGAEVEVIARLVDPSTVAAVMVRTRVPARAPEIASVVDVLPGAGWHEREAAEMFGIRFVGHPDPRPLLTEGAGAPALRKATPLPARVETPWPGADDTARRRGRVPGVRDEWRESAP